MRHTDQRTCGFYIPLYVYRYLPADTGTLIRQDFPFLIRNRAAFPYSIGNLVLCGLATGGQPFMDLMLEENTGRFVGKMSYPSHHNPLWYNFLTIIWGWTPWTLVLLISLFGLKWNEMHLLPAGNSFTGRIRKVWDNIRSQSPIQLFIWIVIIAIFVFYCIPKSKRSVYLLPIYPFMAVLIAQYLEALMQKGAKVFKISAYIFASLCLLLTVVFFAVRCQMIPDSIWGNGRHAAENIAFMQALESTSFLFPNG